MDLINNANIAKEDLIVLQDKYEKLLTEFNSNLSKLEYQ